MLQDWNTLLQGFSELEFCLLPNETQPETVTTTTASSPLNATSTPTATTSADLYEELEGFSLQNTSLSISVSFRAHTSSHSQLHFGSTHLYSKFPTEELGIKGIIW